MEFEIALQALRNGRFEVNLSFTEHQNIFSGMEYKDGASVVADLTTVGRKSGEPRTVELRFTYLGGNFYASSSRVEGKHWCQNLLKNPSVEITARGEKRSCVAKLVTDEALRRRILSLRDSPPQLERVVFEIKPVA